MKPFDLERAKAGAPVQTRSDRAARIVAFDRNHPDFPLVALVTYEPVFGAQSLFDGAPEDAEIAAKFAEGIAFFPKQKMSSSVFFTSGVELAMRRIIAEPKRWTVEDQKAGLLPDVGAKCRQGHKDEIVVAVTEKFVVTECQDMSVCTTRKDVFMRSYNPIETPEEKAQRLRGEWCIKALSSCSILSGMQKYELKRLGGYIEDIYDALLSGELTMPGKVDE